MGVLGGGCKLKWKARYLFSRIYDLNFGSAEAPQLLLGRFRPASTPTAAPLAPAQKTCGGHHATYPQGSPFAMKNFLLLDLVFAASITNAMLWIMKKLKEDVSCKSKTFMLKLMSSRCFENS